MLSRQRHERSMGKKKGLRSRLAPRFSDPYQDPIRVLLSS